MMVSVSTKEKENRQSIIENIQENVFVEAGAGAGKTTLIIQRVINQIRAGIRPQNLVLITFTNASAAELYEKMEQALEEKEKKCSKLEERERFQYALEHLNEMTISTIHSFCYKLLKECCFEAKLPFDVALLENEETFERQKLFLKQWMNGLEKTQVDELENVISILGQNVYFKYHVLLENAFFDICEKAEDIHVVSMNENDLQRLKTQFLKTQEEADDLKQKICEEWNLLFQILPQIVNVVENTSYVKTEDLINEKRIYANIASIYMNLKEGMVLDDKKLQEVQNSFYGDEVRIYMSRKKNGHRELIHEHIKQYFAIRTSNGAGKKLYEEWETLLSQVEEEKSVYVYFVIMKYALQAKEAYESTLDGKKVSNDELLQRARKLVCDSSQARKFFARRYRYIYVDEFQDTDHVQAELLWRLACDETNHLREGALFVVGDPKQAIYRFRGGEPEVYYDIRKRMETEKNTTIYQLHDNYRSNSKLISWINQEFGRVMKNEKTEYQNMNCGVQAIKENLQEAKNVLQGVYAYQTGCNGQQNKKEEEAKELAKLILELVNGSHKIYKRKEQEDGTVLWELKPITYSDFLILSYTKWDTKCYLQALQKEGIPVEISGEISIKENKAIHTFLYLYHYLTNPFEKRAKAGASFVVLPEKDVEEIERKCEPRLKQLMAEVVGKSRYGIAQYLVEHMEYLVPWDVEIRQEQILSVQTKLRQMTEYVFAKANGAPENMTEYFIQYINQKYERELRLETNQEAVRFMNLHKAKGLEGNIVILVNRQKKTEIAPCYKEHTKNSNEKYDYYSVISSKSIQKNDTSTRDYIPTRYFTAYAKYKNILPKAKEEEDAEYTRFEYVAATRAREVCIVFEALEENAFLSRYSIAEENNLKLNFNKQNGVYTQQAEKYIPLKIEISEEQRQKVCVNLSPSSLEGELKDTFEEEPRRKEYLKTKETQEKRPKGNIFGTTMHRSFELLITKWLAGGKRDNENLKNIIMQSVCQSIMENEKELLKEGERYYSQYERTKNNEVTSGCEQVAKADCECSFYEQFEQYLVVVKEYLNKVLTHFTQRKDICDWIWKAKEVYTELPFSYYTSRETDAKLFSEIEPYLEARKIEIFPKQKVWINGTADLVVVSEDGTVGILDYKSDSKKTEQVQFEQKLKRRYEGQMTLYRYAMAKIFGKKAEEISVRLYHLYEEA